MIDGQMTVDLFIAGVRSAISEYEAAHLSYREKTICTRKHIAGGA